MRRGDLYLVRRPAGDARKQRVFVIVSRQTIIDSRFSTVVCAPVYSRRDGLATQINIGTNEGLKHDSSVHCDALISIPKSALTDYVGCLATATMDLLQTALRIALAVE